jgi:hypothetical protein
LAGTSPDNGSATFTGGIHFHPILTDDSSCNSLDHLRVYKRELTKEEIDALYLYDGNGLWNLNTHNNAIYTYSNVGIGTAWPEPGIKLNVKGKTHLDGDTEVTGFMRLTPMENAISRENCDEDAEVGRMVYYTDPNAELDDTFAEHTSNWFQGREVKFNITSNHADNDTSDIVTNQLEQTIKLDNNDSNKLERLEFYSNKQDKFSISAISTINGQKDTMEIYKTPDSSLAWTEARRKMEWKRWNTTNGFYGCTKRYDRYIVPGHGRQLEVRYEWRRLDMIGRENMAVFAEIYDSKFEHGIGSSASGEVELIAENWACENLMNEGETGNFVHKCTVLDASSSSRYGGKCIGHVDELSMARCSDTPYTSRGYIFSPETKPCTYAHTYSYNHVCTATDIASGTYGCITSDARMHCTCDNQDGFAPCQTIEDIDYNYE